MITALVAAVAFVPALIPQGNNEPKSLYVAIVRRPTGQNGYEDFLLAADRLREDNSRQRIESLRESPILQRSKAIVDRYSGVLSSIRAGLKKKFHNPRESIVPAAFYPEFNWLEDITAVFIADSYVKYALGNGPAGMQSLVEAYEFLLAVQHSGTIVFYRSTIKPKVKVIDQIVKAMSRASWPELTNLENWAKKNLNIGDDISAIIENEKNDLVIQFDNVTTGKWAKVRDSANPLFEQIGQMKVADQIKIQEMVLNDMNHAFGLWEKVLRQPEAEWGTPEYPEYTTWGARFASAYGDSLEKCMEALVVERTKMRMLILGCRAYEYRWTYDKMPAKLEDFNGDAVIIDPFSDSPFTYSTGADRSIVLNSKGSKRFEAVSLSSLNPTVK